jgi:hypothetical protein
MRKPMIPILLLLVLALTACGVQSPTTLPVQPTPSQPAAQGFAPTGAPTLTPEESPTLTPFTAIRGEQLIIQTAALEKNLQGQWSLHITGQKATPCHEIQWQTAVEGQEVQVEIGARAKADVMCAQVITDFEQIIPLPDLPSGSYQVFINSILVGEIQG